MSELNTVKPIKSCVVHHQACECREREFLSTRNELILAQAKIAALEVEYEKLMDTLKKLHAEAMGL